MILKQRSKLEPETLTPTKVKDETSQIPTYLITFIFPLLFINTTPNSANISAYLCFAALVLLLTFRTNIALVNPALIILGYHIYAIDTSNKRDQLVISREALSEGAQTYCTPLSKSLHFHHTTSKGPMDD